MKDTAQKIIQKTLQMIIPPTPIEYSEKEIEEMEKTWMERQELNQEIA